METATMVQVQENVNEVSKVRPKPPGGKSTKKVTIQLNPSSEMLTAEKNMQAIGEENDAYFDALNHFLSKYDYLCLDILTEAPLPYTSARTAAKDLGVAPSTITRAIGKNRAIKGWYVEKV